MLLRGLPGTLLCLAALLGAAAPQAAESKQFSDWTQENYLFRLNYSLSLASDIIVTWDKNGRKTPGADQSLWLVAAALSQHGKNETVVEAGKQLAAALLIPRLYQLYLGGNDGWLSWPTAETYLRFRPLIDADTKTFPINVTKLDKRINNETVTSPVTLSTIFRLVMTNSQYLQLDRTGNHAVMNSVARFLVELAFPKACNATFKSNDPIGEKAIRGQIVSIPING
jgi:hypothetical protein